MTWRLDITRGRPEEATGLKQMPIRARTHKTGAGGMSASLIGHSGRFQTIHHYSVDVAHGFVLLFGIGTRGPCIMGFKNEVEQSFYSSPSASAC